MKPQPNRVLDWLFGFIHTTYLVVPLHLCPYCSLNHKAMLNFPLPWPPSFTFSPNPCIASNLLIQLLIGKSSIFSRAKASQPTPEPMSLIRPTSTFSWIHFTVNSSFALLHSFPLCHTESKGMVYCYACGILLQLNLYLHLNGFNIKLQSIASNIMNILIKFSCSNTWYATFLEIWAMPITYFSFWWLVNVHWFFSLNRLPNFKNQ